jgi:hypothetical protein
MGFAGYDVVYLSVTTVQLASLGSFFCAAWMLVDPDDAWMFLGKTAKSRRVLRYFNKNGLFYNIWRE